MSDILKSAFLTVDPEGNRGTVFALWGPPSSAKTSTVLAIAKELGLPLLWISPLATGDAKFGVVPSIVVRKGHERILCPSPVDMDVFSYELGADGVPDYEKPLWPDGIPRGILFLDEFNARPDIQASIMAIAAMRRWGDHYLGEGVIVILAANPTAMSAGGYEPPEALMSRCGHLDIEPVGHDSWSGYIGRKYNGAMPKRRLPATAAERKGYLALEAKMFKELGPYMKKTAEDVVAFTRENGPTASSAGHFNVTPDNPKVKAARAKATNCREKYAIPTVRTWDYAICALASARWQGFDATTQYEIVAAYVGGKAATEFFVWLDSSTLPNPIEILTGAATYVHDPSKPGNTKKVVRAVVDAMAMTPTTAAGVTCIGRGWRFLNAMRVAAGASQVCTYVEPLVTKGLYGPKYPGSNEFMQAANDLVNAANGTT